MIPVHVQTLIVANTSSPCVLILRPEGEPAPPHTSRIVPIWIGMNEAAQLGMALENIRLPRPMTHDLFLDALTNLDCRVDHVLITDIKEATFYSRLTLRQYGRLIQLDARPSDSITLAIREEAPIYIEESVLETASFPYLFKQQGETLSPEEEAEFHRYITELRPDDLSGTL